MTRLTCDSSVIVATLSPWHPQHDVARTAFVDVEVLVAHALAETFSVLTRMPEGYRASAASVLEALQQLERPAVALSAERVLPILAELTRTGVSGGATYDALIAAAAAEHDLTLLTLDRRARAAYEVLGGEVRFLS